MDWRSARFGGFGTLLTGAAGEVECREQNMPCRNASSRGPGIPHIVLLGCCLWLTAVGCRSARTDPNVIAYVQTGDYGRARQAVASNLEADPRSRKYLYDRMQLVLLTLADGLPAVAEKTANEVFEVLRTQGLNADRTVAAVLTWEGVKIWKGEPFEQAMMYFYIAVQKAMLGEWDNARAASLNSLFLLKDFGRNESGTRKTMEQIAAEAVRYKGKGKADYLDAGYTAAETTFALGYLMNAVANMAMAGGDPDRKADAEDCLRSAEAINDRLRDEQEKQSAAYAAQAHWYRAAGNDLRLRAQLDQYRSDLLSAAPEEQPGLSPVLDRLRSRAFNTILVVDYGLGPTKERYGPDGVLARFRQARGWHGTDALRIKVNGNPDPPVPVACNLNEMAKDHMWNNMEDVRKAKSYLGSAMVAAGAAAMASGNEYAQYAGLAIALAGLAVKASARADISHCEIMPQRVYFAPITIREPNSTVELRIGEPEGALLMVLCGLDPPPDSQRIQLRYVRLPPNAQTPPWASGRVLYANDHYDGPVPGEELPYILGGKCVRKPTHVVLERYQRAGQLTGVTLDELVEVYTAEGIALDGPDEPNAVHVLEGGTSLACPLPGTVGFARLFGQEHGPYRPRSAALVEFKKRVGLAHEASIAAARQRPDDGAGRGVNPVRKVGSSRSPGGSGNRKP